MNFLYRARREDLSRNSWCENYYIKEREKKKKGLSWFYGGDDTEIIFVNAKEGRRTEGHSGNGCVLDLLMGRVAARTSAPRFSFQGTDTQKVVVLIFFKVFLRGNLNLAVRKKMDKKKTRT